LNDNGRALLINAIVYIRRFTEDRPIARTRSVFAGPVARARSSTISYLEHDDWPLSWITNYLSGSAIKMANATTRAEYRTWLARNHDYLAPDDALTLAVDKDLVAFGTPYDKLEFFDKAIADFETPGDAKSRASRLLVRYAPDGPSAEASVEKWKLWLDENRNYLFFSEAGGYRWYIDSLAKKRGVPSAKLRGPTRATVSEKVATDTSRH